MAHPRCHPIDGQGEGAFQITRRLTMGYSLPLSKKTNLQEINRINVWISPADGVAQYVIGIKQIALSGYCQDRLARPDKFSLKLVKDLPSQCARCNQRGVVSGRLHIRHPQAHLQKIYHEVEPREGIIHLPQF